MYRGCLKVTWGFHYLLTSVHQQVFDSSVTFFAAMDHRSIGCIGNGPWRLSVCGLWSVVCLRRPFEDFLVDIGQNALPYLGFYSDTATSKCIPASSNVSSNQVPNSFFFSGLGPSQDYSYSSSLNFKKTTLVGSISSDLADKGNFGINKVFLHYLILHYVVGSGVSILIC